MITLSLKGTTAVLGTIDESDLQFMIDQLEEEFDEDTDYFISSATVEMLQDNGASDALVRILKDAVGSSEGVDINWKRA